MIRACIRGRRGECPELNCLTLLFEAFSQSCGCDESYKDLTTPHNSFEVYTPWDGLSIDLSCGVYIIRLAGWLDDITYIKLHFISVLFPLNMKYGVKRVLWMPT
jgi:hypothetical protein